MIDLKNIKIIKSSRRSISVHIERNGTIVVKAPNLIPKFLINQFIKQNEAWIEKKIAIVKNHSPKNLKYVNGEKIVFLGEEYKLSIGNFSSIKIEKDMLLFPKALEFRANKEMENWYIRQAKELITAQANLLAHEMNTSFVSISLSVTKSKWGSCTSDNRLQFNWKLIQAPFLVLRYVVVHELAHTLEKNHSHKFWSRVSVFNPSFKQQIKWLKTHGNGLMD